MIISLKTLVLKVLMTYSEQMYIYKALNVDKLLETFNELIYNVFS